jgi:hypothetical protein
MVTRSASEELGYIRRGDRLVVSDPFGRQRRVAFSSAGDLLPLVSRDLETAMHQRKRRAKRARARREHHHRFAVARRHVSPTPNGQTRELGYVIERLASMKQQNIGRSTILLTISLSEDCLSIILFRR